MHVPSSMVGRIIGKGGEMIQRLQRDSGARIDVNTSGDPCPVRISGPRDAIARARQMVAEVLDRAHGGCGGGGCGGGGCGGGYGGCGGGGCSPWGPGPMDPAAGAWGYGGQGDGWHGGACGGGCGAWAAPPQGMPPPSTMGSGMWSAVPPPGDGGGADRSYRPLDAGRNRQDIDLDEL